MSKIAWQTDESISVGPYQIAMGADIVDGYRQGCGVKRNSPLKLRLKRALYPIVKLREDLLVDGFIERDVGRIIREHLTQDATVLEVGCGDMSLRRFLPKDICYNAIDLELADFHVLNAMRSSNPVNLACATAKNLPIADNIVTLLIATETLEHIPDPGKAVDEMFRVAAPGAVLACSIPNNYCYKYDQKGKNPRHINEWTYQGFIDFMAQHGFDVISGRMKGKWIAFPRWLTAKSYTLPLSSDDEYHNTNFIYAFRARK